MYCKGPAYITLHIPKPACSQPVYPFDHNTTHPLNERPTEGQERLTARTTLPEDGLAYIRKYILLYSLVNLNHCPVQH